MNVLVNEGNQIAMPTVCFADHDHENSGKRGPTQKQTSTPGSAIRLCVKLPGMNSWELPKLAVGHSARRG